MSLHKIEEKTVLDIRKLEVVKSNGHTHASVDFQVSKD